MADRTKVDFELWVENGVRFLSKIEVNEKIEIIIHEDLTAEPMSSAKNEKKSSKIKKSVSNFCFNRILNIITNNLELIYAVAPDIAPESAIKIAFTTGLINDLFSKTDLQLAVMTCLKTRR